MRFQSRTRVGGGARTTPRTAQSGTWCTRYLRMGLIGAVLLLGPSNARAVNSLAENLLEAVQGRVPHETAVGLYVGRAYDWADLYFTMATCQALFDYDALWPHQAPEGLKIRFEGSAGTAVGTEFSGARLIASGDFLAVYEFGVPSSGRLVPYIEGGVGVIYTDFQREHQAYRVNFNPVAGIGLRTKSFFVTLRAHHLSNADLNDENRGINSIVLGFGVYLGGR